MESESAISASGRDGRGKLMKKITQHLFVPASVTFVFFIAASLPIDLLGCRNRGLLAASIAIAAGVLGIIAAVKALVGRMRGDENSPLWMASALIFAIPAIFIVLIAT